MRATLDRVSVGDQITADVVVSNGAATLGKCRRREKGTGTPPAPHRSASLQAGRRRPGARLRPGEPRRQARAPRSIPRQGCAAYVHLHALPAARLLPADDSQFRRRSKRAWRKLPTFTPRRICSASASIRNTTRRMSCAIMRAHSWRTRKSRPLSTGSSPPSSKPERTDISRFFNLFYSEADGQMTHSLSTDIIAPDGHLYRSYYDNDWKPADVLNDLTAAVANPPQERTAVSSARAGS